MNISFENQVALVTGAASGLALEYATRGIRINAVCPGMIQTPMSDKMIAEGQGEELEKMIERARHIVTGLRSIEVVLDEATEEMPPGVVLWVHRDDIGPGSDPTHRDWIDWMATTFPPDVCQNFTLLSFYHDDGR